ncbi:MAG: cyclic nucleotide-binding domain-containing protein, partial [bacterium]
MYSIIEKVIFLQGVSIFAQVRTDDLRHLAAIAEEVTVLPQCHIYEVNENADAFYLITDGRVRLHRDGEEIEIRGQGEAIGEWALFDDQPRLVT